MKYRIIKDTATLKANTIGTVDLTVKGASIGNCMFYPESGHPYRVCVEISNIERLN